MTRRELREHVFRLLFTCDFYKNDRNDMEEQMELYFTHPGGDDVDYPPEEVDPETQKEIRKRAETVLAKIDDIDSKINETSIGWKTDRMSRADLTILRLGMYELLFDDQIPDGVAINEAVLLAKKFGGEESASFINGILGKVQRCR